MKKNVYSYLSTNGSMSAFVCVCAVTEWSYNYTDTQLHTHTHIYIQTPETARKLYYIHNRQNVL